MMRTILGLGGVLVLGLASAACSGSSGGGGSHIMTPEERLAEEEKAAYDAEQAKKKRVAEEGEPVVEEPTAKPFDQKQAEMELTRATRSAESCTGVVADAKERGEATVSITFVNDGSVSKATVSPPFEGTTLGDCIVNAYKSVIVPPFDQSNHAMTWELKLSDPPKDPNAPKGKKSK